jgi:hypothetical protein
MNADQARTWIAPISQGIAILVAFGGLVVWGAGLQNRIDKTETQLQELKAAMASVSQQPSGAAPNPCTTLADRFAAALAIHTRAGDSDANSIRSLMGELGCMNGPKK